MKLHDNGGIGMEEVFCAPKMYGSQGVGVFVLKKKKQAAGWIAYIFFVKKDNLDTILKFYM